MEDTQNQLTLSQAWSCWQDYWNGVINEIEMKENLENGKSIRNLEKQ